MFFGVDLWKFRIDGKGTKTNAKSSEKAKTTS